MASRSVGPFQKSPFGDGYFDVFRPLRGSVKRSDLTPGFSEQVAATKQVAPELTQYELSDADRAAIAVVRADGGSSVGELAATNKQDTIAYLVALVREDIGAIPVQPPVNPEQQ